MRLKAIGPLVFLIASLAAVITVPVIAWAQTQSSTQPPAAQPFALRHSVAVIRPSSPMFDTLLERWFPGVTGVNYFQQIKPLLAIVHNNTRRQVKAYVVKWTITNADGTTSTAMLPVMQEPLDAWELTGTRTVLGPAGTGDGTELVSPFFGWTKKHFSALQPRGLASIPFSASARNPLVVAVQNATSVQATLDGAVFGDGVFVGPDTAKLYERFQAEQKAELDEGAWITTELSDGAGVEAIRDALSEQIYAGVNSTGIDPASLYTSARGRQASRLLRLLDQEGILAIQKAAAMQAQSVPLLLHKQTSS